MAKSRTIAELSSLFLSENESISALIAQLISLGFKTVLLQDRLLELAAQATCLCKHYSETSAEVETQFETIYEKLIYLEFELCLIWIPAATQLIRIESEHRDATRKAFARTKRLAIKGETPQSERSEPSYLRRHVEYAADPWYELNASAEAMKHVRRNVDRLNRNGLASLLSEASQFARREKTLCELIRSGLLVRTD